MKPALSAIAEAEIGNIAQTILKIGTLETRNADRMDFHSVAVWSIKDALEAAYLAGMVDHYRGTA